VSGAPSSGAQEGRAPAVPRLAASLILLSRAEGGGLVTLLLKRTAKASFMPSALVFPGGGLEEEDERSASADAEAGARLSAWREWGFESELAALAQRRCALRECDEEAGPKLSAGLTAQALPCVGRWLTPPRLPKRFDTSFWLGLLDEPLPIELDRAEVVEGGWWSPSEALEAYAARELELAPPTIRLLADQRLLERSAELDALWALPAAQRLSAVGERLSGRPAPSPICPNLVRQEQKNELWLCFPGDEASSEPERRYEPDPCRPHHLWRPLDEPSAPWRLAFGERSLGG